MKRAKNTAVVICALAMAAWAWAGPAAPAEALDGAELYQPTEELNLGGEPTDPDDGRPPLAPVITIAKGFHSQFGMDRPGFDGAKCLISGPEAWKAFWMLHTGDPEAEPPYVDFRRHVVIAVVQGPQSSGGGPNIAILGVAQPGPIAHIVVFDDRRPGMLDVITNPFHIAKVSKRSIPPMGVCFDQVRPIPGTSVIVGRAVVENSTGTAGQPVPRVMVRLLIPREDGTVVERRTFTGEDGSYFFVNVFPADEALLVARHPAFEVTRVSIEVPGDTLIGQPLILIPKPEDDGGENTVELEDAPEEVPLTPTE